MFHIAICDNDLQFIKEIETLLIDAGMEREEVLFYEYSSGEQMIFELQGQAICDLLILDRNLGKWDGNQIAMKFRKKFPTSVLVFCSGICQPTDESFKAMPFRYLLKSYSKARMLTELKEIITEVRWKQKSPHINGKYYYNIVRLKPENILYIDNAKYGSHIHVHKDFLECEYDNYVTTDKKILELYHLLKDYGFAYVHNSYIVNMNYIIRLQSAGEITLVDGTILSVARSKLKDFRKIFTEWISKKY